MNTFAISTEFVAIGC